jgi:hypothetical protein
MTRNRAADDFATIRARMEELRREPERADARQRDLGSVPRTEPAEAYTGRRWKSVQS